MLALFLGGCTGNSRKATEAQLLRQCFDAIQSNDWESYAQLTVTTADILHKALDIKPDPLRTAQSYIGDVLKPEQMKRLEADFRRAVAGGPGLIDFKNATFLAVGRVIWIDDAGRGMGGARVPAKTYSLQIRLQGASLDSQDLYPLFTMVHWEGRWRLVSLEYAPAGRSAPDAQPATRHAPSLVQRWPNPDFENLR